MKKYLSILIALLFVFTISACKKETKTTEDEGLDTITETYDSYTFGTFVVVNGTVVLADINATQNIYEYKKTADGSFLQDEDGNNTILMVEDEDGNLVPKQSFVTKDAAKEWYGMKNAGSTLEFYEQMELVEDKLLADQSLDITVTDGSGVIDGLSSVSVGHTVASVKQIVDSIETTTPTDFSFSTATAPTVAEDDQLDVADGTYFAAADAFSNSYRYYTVVTVADGVITKVLWSGYHIDGGAAGCEGEDKYTCAANGNYGMEARATKGEWNVQALATMNWIVENQNLTPTFNDENGVDAITGATIHVKEIFDLVNEALDGSPVPAGDYTNDGYYYIETTRNDKTTTYARMLEE